jgi:uncharacterized protein YbaP (TraB family)
MRGRYHFLLACIIFSGCIRRDPYREVKLENSLLWEISGNGLKSPSYLFGTNHLVGKRFADSLPVIGEKFKSCSAVVGEIVIDTTNTHKARPNWLLTENGLLQIFTFKEFSAIAESLKHNAGLNLITFNNLKPAGIQLLFLKAIAPKSISASNPSLDQYFQDEGRKRGDKIIGLETFDFQSDLIFGAPIELQKKQLLSTVAHLDQARQNIDSLNKFYCLQDINRSAKLLLVNQGSTQEEMDKMIKNRDLNWLNKLPEIIKQQPTFIAVGVAHLLWDCGLINQLRLKGFTVKPVKI